jgi:carboxyl-terminal processing protease
VGSQTFAKGTVQSLLPPLANGSALKITTGIYLTPNGRTFNEQGLVPDVLLTEGESAVTTALAMLAKPSLVQTSELQDKNN